MLFKNVLVFYFNMEPRLKRRSVNQNIAVKATKNCFKIHDNGKINRRVFKSFTMMWFVAADSSKCRDAARALQAGVRSLHGCER